MIIQEIISNGQNRRHENHVRAGKNIKEKWKQEVRKELIDEFEKMIDERLNLMGTNWEMYNAIEILSSFKKELKEMKEK